MAVLKYLLVVSLAVIAIKSLIGLWMRRINKKRIQELDSSYLEGRR
jgi:hypothetical protein